MGLFIHTLACFGFVFIAGHSKISLPLREWLSRRANRNDSAAQFSLALIECAACLSFHVGWATSLLGFRLGLGYLWLDAAVLAFYSCGTSLILGKFVGIVE